MLQQLDPEQQAAATAPLGAHIVVAGPGSGKTRVITARISHLINTLHADAADIAAFTFTNAAAKALKQRIASVTDPETTTAVTAGTFHSWAARFLREHCAAAGIPRAYTIYDREDSVATVTQIAADHPSLNHPQLPAGAVVGYISQQKSRHRDAAAAADRYPANDNSPLAVRDRLWLEYEQGLRREQALDFDDLLLRALDLLVQNADLRRAAGARHRHILVDEFQDTNPVQQRLALALAYANPERPSLFVVGDPDQSIYAFRNADLAGFIGFQQRCFRAWQRLHTGAHAEPPASGQYLLTRNYRSTANIITAAQSLIDHNVERIRRAAAPTRAAGRRLRWIVSADPEAEAEAIATDIAAIIAANPQTAAYQHFCIAYRTHQQSRPLAEALRAAGIPCTVRGEYEFFRRQEIKAYLAWLRIIVNPHDAVALNTARQQPRSGIGDRTWKRLSFAAGELDYSVGTIIAMAAVNPEPLAEYRLRGRPVAATAAFHAQTERLRAAAADLTPQDIIDYLSEQAGLAAWVSNLTNPQFRQQQVADLRALANPNEFGPDSLEQFLEYASTAGSAGPPPDLNRATLTTLHQAKGLEFPHVYIAGAEDGLLPHQLSAASSEIEEERRLLYVGITRAHDTVALSWCERRRGKPAQPSPFLRQIPPAAWESPLPLPEPEEQK